MLNVCHDCNKNECIISYLRQFNNQLLELGQRLKVLEDNNLKLDELKHIPTQ